ncbi:MAG: helix-turn-helix domain-containing protein [Acidimicrobiales bacterium]
MTAPPQVTVAKLRYWADKPQQLAQLLATSKATAIRDPSGQPVRPNEVVVLTLPKQWAEDSRELRDALLVALGETHEVGTRSRTATGVAAPVENRLVLTVEEAAQLLGISRSFAYEAVQRGEIPSMRIGRRILVPKAALKRLLEQANPSE